MNPSATRPIPTSPTTAPPITASSPAGPFGELTRTTAIYSLGIIASTVENFTGKNVVRYFDRLKQRAELGGQTF